MPQTTVNIKGMHCRSCEILVEDELLKVNGVKKAEVSEKEGVAHIYYEGAIDRRQIERAVCSAGYELGMKEKAPLFSKRMRDYVELGYAFLIMALIYLIGNELGIFKLAVRSGSNYSNLPVVFLVGLTAGVSTCMALVGGLVLAASARFVEKHPQSTMLQKFKPHLFFNMGRVIGFTVLGGIIGYAGSLFQLSSTTLGFMTIAVGLVMALLGLQLIEIFPRLNNFKLMLPKGIARSLGIHEQTEKEYSHTNSFMMGALTFFLPCGFTQAMQLFAISSGKPLTGALTMGIFALGTVPGLLGIGGLTSVIKGAFARQFFKFAGLVVISLAIFNISNGLNLTGFNVNAFITPGVPSIVSSDPNVTLENGVQVVKMTQTASGYTPNTFTIKKDVPVRWVITSEDAFSCAASIVSSQLGIRKNLEKGENIIEFTPTEAGNIRFSCSMGMYTGSFNVVDGNGSSSSEQTDAGAANTTVASQPVNSAPVAPKGASCGGGGGGCGCGAKAQKQAALDTDKTPPSQATTVNSVQVLQATYSVADDIQPNKFTVKAGQPVRFDIDAKEDGAGCMGSIMVPGLDNNPQGFEKGKTTSLSFTPTKPGSYTITCAMGVPRGTIIVN